MNEQQNEAVVRGIYEAFGRVDVPSLLAALAPDVEWTIPGRMPYAGAFHGHDGVTTMLMAVFGSIEIEKFQPREYVASGDKVVVLGEERSRARLTGRVFEQEFAHVYTVRGGLVTRVVLIEDTGAQEAALAAAAGA